MDKLFTINTPEYQEAQESFFNYNVEGKMTIEQSTIVDKMNVGPSILVKEVK